VRDAVTGTFVDFRITPKGQRERAPLPGRILAPYVVLGGSTLATVILVDDPGDASGFYLLALLNALMYTIAIWVIVVMHARENAYGWSGAAFGLVGQTAAALVITALFFGASQQAVLPGLHGITAGAPGLRITEVKYRAAGAGSAEGQFQVSLKPVSEWGRSTSQ